MTKSIWFEEFPFEYAAGMAANCAISHLGIELVEAGDDYVKARMPVDQRTSQPAGALHGGVSVVLAETLASWAATFTVDHKKRYCVGLEVNANHVRVVREGFVTGIATPVHLGRTTQIWQVHISDENEKLICVSRITMAVLDIPSQYRSERGT